MTIFLYYFVSILFVVFFLVLSIVCLFCFDDIRSFFTEIKIAEFNKLIQNNLEENYGSLFKAKQENPSLTHMPMSNKRFLVVARVGSDSHHKKWLENKLCQRNWDLQLSAYGDNAALISDADLPTIIDQGAKWDSLARHFRAYPELLDSYEYVMLPDDDLLMTTEGINRIFEMVVANDLFVAQPSLSSKGYVSYPSLMQVPKFVLRYTNHIDCMSPCFKASYLKTILPLIEKYICGWGADHVWALLMEEPPYKSAVLDEVSMIHTRAFYTGTLYDKFAKLGVNPFDEVRRVTSLFENFPKRTVVYGGVLRNGKYVGNIHVQLRNSAHLLTVAIKTKTPYKIFRKGLGMLVQIFTQSKYRPDQLRLEKNNKNSNLIGMSRDNIASSLV